MNARTENRSPAAARRRPASSRKSGFGGTLFGIFIGVALGLSLAAAVAFYLMKAGNPYVSASPAASRDVFRSPLQSTFTQVAQRSPVPGQAQPRRLIA